MKSGACFEYLVFRGTYGDDRQANLRPIGVVTSRRNPNEGLKTINDLTFLGKARGGKLLFREHPCLIETSEPRREGAGQAFSLAIRRPVGLDRVEVLRDGNRIGSIDRRQRATVTLNVERAPRGKGIRVEVRGSYDSIVMFARRFDSPDRRYLHQDDVPNDGEGRVVRVPWASLPPKRTAVEVIAVRGLSVARRRSPAILVPAQRPEISVAFVGFQELIPGEVPEYEYLLQAKVLVHGEPMSEPEVVWEVEGHEHRGEWLDLRRPGLKSFNVTATLRMPGVPKVSTVMQVDPRGLASVAPSHRALPTEG